MGLRSDSLTRDVAAQGWSYSIAWLASGKAGRGRRERLSPIRPESPGGPSPDPVFSGVQQLHSGRAVL